MDQLEQKEIANPPPTFPPPLVSRKEPEPAPIRKNSNKTEPSRTPQSSNSRKEQRSDKNIKELVKAQDEDPTASERVRQRDRSRSRDRDRRNFNRDGRNYHNHRRDRNDRGDRFGGRSSHYAGDEPSNKETYYKTKLCPNYLEGKCLREGRCSFAHGQHQLRQLPNFKKTRLCLDYLHGKCTKSSRECKYAHGQSEIKHEGYSDFSRDRQRERSKQEIEAEMKKYRISNVESYGFGTGYSHPSLLAPPVPAPAPVYPPVNYSGPHVHSWQSQSQHYGGRAGDAWSYGVGGGWTPRDNIPPASLVGSFDPTVSSSAASTGIYRSWDYGAPVGVGRGDGGMAGSTFNGPLPGSFSSGGFSSVPTHFGSSTSSGSSYAGNSGHYGLTNPPPPPPSPSSLPSAPTGPFISMPYHRSGAETTASYESFSMGSEMPRRPTDR